MKKKNIYNRLILSISFILYRIFIDYSYFNEIVIEYNYYGFKDNRSMGSFLLSWIILFFFMLLLLKIIKKEYTLSSIIILVISTISIPPLTTLIYANFLDRRFLLLSFIYWTTILVIYQIISKKNVKRIDFKFNRYQFDDKFALLIGLFSILLVIYISWKYTGFRINFNLDNVYDLRMEARTYNIPVLLKYLFEWSRSINIVLLAYYLYNKKYFLSSLFITSQILSFGVDGLKSTLFMTFLTIILSIIFNKNNQAKAGSYILYGLTGLTFIGVLEKIILKSSNIIEIIVRRLMILPVYLNSCYVDFFMTHQPDLLRRSFLKLFGLSSSYTDLEFTIGKLYFDRPLMRCNNGLISEAVTNFGVIGVILGPILFILVLRLMDKCVIGSNKKIVLITGIYFGIRLTDTFLTVGLFTHGFIIALIIMMLLREFKVNDVQCNKLIVNRGDNV